MENTYKLGSRILWPSDKVIPVDGKILDGVSQLGVAPQCGRIWETPCFHRDWLAEKPKCLLEKSCELFFAMVFVAFRWGNMEYSYVYFYINIFMNMWNFYMHLCCGIWVCLKMLRVWRPVMYLFKFLGTSDTVWFVQPGTTMESAFQGSCSGSPPLRRTCW